MPERGIPNGIGYDAYAETSHDCCHHRQRAGRPPHRANPQDRGRRRHAAHHRVEGGGCSGFQYKFDVEHAQAEDDLVIERDDAVVLVDPASVPFLGGVRGRFRRRPDRRLVPRASIRTPPPPAAAAPVFRSKHSYACAASALEAIGASERCLVGDVGKPAVRMIAPGSKSCGAASLTARNTAATRAALRSGLARKSDMPASRHSRHPRERHWRSARRSAVARSHAATRIDLVAARPSISGICTSISTRS